MASGVHCSQYMLNSHFFIVIFIAELLVVHGIEPARTKICLSFSFSSSTLTNVKYGPSALTWVDRSVFP